MPYTVDFNTVSTAGLESSPAAAALAGLRAHEARYFKNKYDHVFNQLHQRPILDHHRAAAAAAGWPLGASLDVDPQRPASLADDAQHAHRRSPTNSSHIRVGSSSKGLSRP